MTKRLFNTQEHDYASYMSAARDELPKKINNYKRMKKIFLTALACIALLSKTYADEGMWLPLLLGQEVYNKMKKEGLRMSKDQLYSINKNSLKDAIVIFGGGCTGEMVSNEGLVFTNHHCGYSAIAAASTVEHNYLSNGFYAKTHQEEIPGDGLAVKFLLRIDDVTDIVLKKINEADENMKPVARYKVIDSLENTVNNPEKFIMGKVKSFFNNNQFYLFTYQAFNDVRLVAAPPESLGKFGGDTDNWEWPRHTCDISIFRVYADKDGNPANYSPDNVPYQPKWVLPVSMKGVKEGDFTMVWGYPGSTNRYETSYSVKYATDYNDPAIVKLRGLKLGFMKEEMLKSEATRLKMADAYARLANYWKFYDAEREALLKYNVYEKKHAVEAEFQQWADDKPAYKNLMTDWATTYADYEPYAKLYLYITEGFYNVDLLKQVSHWDFVLSRAGNKIKFDEEVKQEVVAEFKRGREDFLKGTNFVVDKKFLAAVMKTYYDDIADSLKPMDFYKDIENNYGSLDDEATYKKYAEDVYNKSIIFDDAKWDVFLQNLSKESLEDDPGYQCHTNLVSAPIFKIYLYYSEFGTSKSKYFDLYTKALFEKDPEKMKNTYPDANFTMRMTYGTVEPYSPRDAVFYDYYTTAKGVLEKYIPGDYEFNLTPKAVEELEDKDFAGYKDKHAKTLMVNFITNNDITGGNSGSPVLNGNGELVGLAFDGNYESMCAKMYYDAPLNRCICVDIRYVLWVMDKVVGAKDMFNELKLVR